MMAPLDQESPSWPGGYEMDMKKQYEEAYRLCYLRGPEGLLIGLAEELRSSVPA